MISTAPGRRPWRVILMMLGLSLQAWTAPPAAAGTILRHTLTIKLDPAQHLLKAEDVIELGKTIPSRKMVFELSDRAAIDAVKVDRAQCPYTFRNGRLTIAWPKGRPAHRLYIAYKGRFDDPVAPNPLNTDNPGLGVSGTIQPQGVMLLAGSGWYPDDRSADTAITLTVDAPAGMVAVTSGNPLGHSTGHGRTLSRWAVPGTLQDVSLVAGPFQVHTRRFGQVTAATYFSASLQHLSDAYLEAVGRYLQRYEKLFGPYAFKQFAVVENFFPTGYGFPGFTLLGRRVLELPFIIHTSLGHEIAHCWWGNGVRVNPSEGNWCEGLTTYVADYLYKEQQGEGREERLRWLRDYANLVSPDNDFPLSRFQERTDPVTRTIGYDKGAMVFHMLRRTVGDDCFWRSLRDIYARYCFKAITWSQIRAVFEQRSHRSLKGFFDQWVFRAGAPNLVLSDIIVQPTERGFAVSGRLRQTPPYFDLDLQLALKAGGRTIRRKVSLTGADAFFRITTDERPQELTADPGIDIFRRLAPEEVPPTINTLKGSGDLRVVVAAGLGPQAMETARRLSVSLGFDQAPIHMESKLSAHELAAHDWLLVGLPADRTLLPESSDRFRIDDGHFLLDAKRYARDRATFFGVFKNPLDSRHTVALFLPAGPSLAEAISTKITHYGAYSYLVFDQTRNQLKGTWPPDHSPMTVRWPTTAPLPARRSAPGQ